jgi:hypothetical protein
VKLARPFRVAVAALLLLFAQAQQVVHPIAHLAHAAEAPGVELVAPEVGDRCIECSLLAAGMHAVAAASTAVPLVAVPSIQGPWAVASIATGAGAWFRSRAPPRLP